MNKINRFLNSTLIYHLLVLMLLFVPSSVYTMYIARKNVPVYLLNFVVTNGVLLLIIYVNLLYLIPVYLKKKQYRLYILFIGILVAFVVFVLYWMQEKVQDTLKYPDEPIIFFIVSTTVNIVQYLLISFFLFNMREKMLQQKRMDEISLEKLKTEINYLRAQINPHFLFNTLNNLYGLALEKSEKTPEIVMRLSKMMDYMLYESDDARVYLKKDVENIENYIAIERIRQGNNADIRFSVTGDAGYQKIVPLLLLPLIENGFKHGVNKQIHAAWLDIQLQILPGEVQLTVRNNYKETQQEEDRNGIGLANLKKRLELFYPGKYNLFTSQNENQFEARLSIQLT